MTVFLVIYEKMFCVYMLENVKTLFFLFLVIHQKWLMKCIFIENGCILEKFIKST